MKRMKAMDLRQTTVAELRDKEKELAEELFALRLKKVVGQLEKPARIQAVRRNLARVMTVISEKAGQS